MNNREREVNLWSKLHPEDEITQDSNGVYTEYRIPLKGRVVPYLLSDAGDVLMELASIREVIQIEIRGRDNYRVQIGNNWFYRDTFCKAAVAALEAYYGIG